MDKLDRILQILRLGVITFILLFLGIVSFLFYDKLFEKDRLAERLQKNTEQLSQIIEHNRVLSVRLEQTEQEIREVHRSLLESQIKLSGLIRDSRGSATQLNQNAESVKEDLSGVIKSIDLVLAKGSAQ